MMVSGFKIKLFSTIALTFLISGLILLLTANYTYAQAYRGLVIDGTKVDLGLQKKGIQIKRSFHITHDFEDRDKVLTLYFRAVDFTSNGFSGTPVFLPKDYLNENASLASWITFDKKSIVLDHYGHTEEIDFTIAIPAGAEPGGKSVAVLVSDKDGENAVDGSNGSSELGISKELGQLLFLTIEGDVKTGLIADALYTTDISNKKTDFFLNLPVNINLVLKNTGNVYLEPHGAIYVYQGEDFQKNITKFELNEDRSFVLPESTRIYSYVWNDGFMYDTFVQDDKTGKNIRVTRFDWDKLSRFRIGKYNIKLLFESQGADGKKFPVQKDATFWVIPWPIILLIVAIILLVLFLILVQIVRKVFLKKEKKSRRKVSPSVLENDEKQIKGDNN